MFILYEFLSILDDYDYNIIKSILNFNQTISSVHYKVNNTSKYPAEDTNLILQIIITNYYEKYNKKIKLLKDHSLKNYILLISQYFRNPKLYSKIVFFNPDSGLNYKIATAFANYQLKNYDNYSSYSRSKLDIIDNYKDLILYKREISKFKNLDDVNYNFEKHKSLRDKVSEWFKKEYNLDENLFPIRTIDKVKIDYASALKSNDNEDDEWE